MAITFEIAQTIDQPIDRVFSFLSNFSNMPLWNYYIQNVTQISKGTINAGSTFEMKRPSDLNIYKITEFDPPNKIIVELQPPGPSLQLIFELKSKNNQTNLTYKWHLDLEEYKMLKYFPKSIFKRMILSIPKRIILNRTKPAVEQNFKKLKELLETRQATLQDGRHVVLPKDLI
jgi:hypothetical protein